MDGCCRYCGNEISGEICCLAVFLAWEYFHLENPLPREPGATLIEVKEAGIPCVEAEQ